MKLNVSDIIAAIALLVSIYTIFSSRKLKKLQEKVMSLEHDLNSTLLEKERNEQIRVKKANLNANIVKLGTDKTRLKIYNCGEANAYNINVSYPEDLKKHIYDDKFPLEKLNSMQSCEVPVLVYSGFPSKSLIKLNWDDEYQKDNETEIMVTW